MTSTRNPMPFTGLLLLLLLLVCSRAAAQEPAAAPPLPPPPAPTSEHLAQLLRELGATDAAAWAALLQGQERQIHDQEAAATRLRQEVAALEQRAAAADATVQRLRTELARLQQLRELAAQLPNTDANPPAKASAPPPAPAKASAPPPAPTKAPAAVPPAATEPPAMPTAEPTPATPTQLQATTATGAAPADLVRWDRDIAPLFEQQCAGCHDPDSKKGGLDVTTFAAVRQGGGSGRSLVPGEPDQSRLFRLISQQERPFMPRDAEPLSAADIAKVRRWIEQGAAEDDAGARAFAAERAQQVAAAAVEATAASAAGAGPMPIAWPAVPRRTVARPSALRSLARSPRAPLLALPGEQQVLVLAADLQPLGVLLCPLAQVEGVGFSADGHVLFAAGGERGRSGQVVVYDVRTGATLATCGDDRDPPLAAAVDRRRELVAMGGASKRTRVVGFDGKERFVGQHDDFVLTLAFAADGALLAAGDRSGVVHLWETRSGRLADSLTGHQGAVNAVAFRGSKLLASAGADGTVRVWDVQSGTEQWRQNAHQGEALAVAFGADGRVASCGSDGRICVFSATGATTARSASVDEWLYAIAFGAGDEIVLAGDWQGRLQCFDVRAKRLSSSVPLATAP